MLCSQCQYDLGDPAPEQCPLCEHVIPEAQRKPASAAGKSRRRRVMFWVLLLVGCAAVGMALKGLLWALAQKPPPLANSSGLESMVSPEAASMMKPESPATPAPETGRERYESGP